MQIKFFCTRWGSEHIGWNDFCRLVKEAGYDGIETPVSFDESEKKIFVEALNKNELLFGGSYYQSLESNVDDMLVNFEKHLLNIASLNPLYIDSQTGKDYFSFEDNSKLISLAQKIENATGIKIFHQTHRNKFLFAAHIAAQYLAKIPSLKLTLDISHWCNVHESFLEDQQEALDQTIKRTRHIHARVGNTQSAQVIDPFSKENEAAFRFHVNCWDKVIALLTEEGAEYLTITPEFGPAPYLLHNPVTETPMADQWEVNIAMLNFLKSRYRQS